MLRAGFVQDNFIRKMLYRFCNDCFWSIELNFRCIKMILMRLKRDFLRCFSMMLEQRRASKFCHILVSKHVSWAYHDDTTCFNAALYALSLFECSSPAFHVTRVLARKRTRIYLMKNLFLLRRIMPLECSSTCIALVETCFSWAATSLSIIAVCRSQKIAGRSKLLNTLLLNNTLLRYVDWKRIFSAETLVAQIVWACSFLRIMLLTFF